jgi:hypothetical protein
LGFGGLGFYAYLCKQKSKQKKIMIQTHLMKLEPPYPVLNIDGTIVRHVATLIEVREAYDSVMGEERIKTVSHPVVDYGDNEYAGVVYYDKELEDCELIAKTMRPADFYLLTFHMQKQHGRDALMGRPEYIVARLKEVGVTIQWPVKKDADGLDTDEPEDHFDIGISIGESEKVGWWMESGDLFFQFNGNGFKSAQELLQTIRNTRSSYYRAFPEHQFDIVFHSNMPEAQPIIAELNANPHL